MSETFITLLPPWGWMQCDWASPATPALTFLPYWTMTADSQPKWIFSLLGCFCHHSNGTRDKDRLLPVLQLHKECREGFQCSRPWTDYWDSENFEVTQMLFAFWMRFCIHYWKGFSGPGGGSSNTELWFLKGRNYKTHWQCKFNAYLRY